LCCSTAIRLSWPSSAVCKLLPNTASMRQWCYSHQADQLGKLSMTVGWAPASLHCVRIQVHRLQVEPMLHVYLPACSQEFIDWALDQGVSDHLQPFIRWSDDEHLVLVCASVRQGRPPARSRVWQHGPASRALRQVADGRHST
jgi:hypothetical protein